MASQYLIWHKQTIEDFSAENINRQYDRGFVFTRTGKGDMVQTRSLRVVLSGLRMTSENRRVLCNFENLQLESIPLPIPNDENCWRIQKMGADFYREKFGPKVFSANVLNALLTNSKRSNFNLLLVLSTPASPMATPEVATPVPTLMATPEVATACGYAVCYGNDQILHYAYPFYDFKAQPGLGMAMMTKAVQNSQKLGRQYVYLGSATKPADRYKLQFENMEWWDGDNWQSDIESLKDIIRDTASS